MDREHIKLLTMLVAVGLICIYWELIVKALAIFAVLAVVFPFILIPFFLFFGVPQYPRLPRRK